MTIADKTSRFIKLDFQKEEFDLPEKFTFPFYYQAHPLALLASDKLQNYLKTQTDWEHNFGLNPNQEGLEIGKMFGVLVVQNQNKELGYLAAFSGKLANQNNHSFFVPPIFDMLTEGSFFRKEEEGLNLLNSKLEELESSEELKLAIQFVDNERNISAEEIKQKKALLKSRKLDRKQQRDQAEESLNKQEYDALLDQLKKESIHESYELKHLVKNWKIRIVEAQSKLQIVKNPIEKIKSERKDKSNALQHRLFDQYHFLNITGEREGLEAIFQNTPALIPPAGAGECAAPKLLQYAFENDLRPLCMAEFWWGTSPNAEVRKHGNFYPSCRSKCEPILGHMMKGMNVDENPMLTNPAIGKQIQIIYEDDALAIINKPPEILSVPGKNIEDSVYSRMKAKYPDATGPLTVHRLDMSTSGIMIIAKTLRVHEHLQRQFIKRQIKKRYIALLDGEIQEREGEINLPLRVDLDNRPQQLVCYEHGKTAITKWKVINVENGQTRIHFFPQTGRTHQLRVHAAHPKGLNAPIIGDDLYGKRVDRLHLHAEWIEFFHPDTKEFVNFTIEAEF